MDGIIWIIHIVPKKIAPWQKWIIQIIRIIAGIQMIVIIQIGYLQ